MGTKNISISDEAYERLKALKKPGESFTDAIERLTSKTSILELVGVLSGKDALQLKSTVRRIREESSERVAETIEKLS